MLDEISFPVALNTLLTVGGMAVFGALLTHWLREYLPDWRFTNLLGLVLTEAVAVVAQVIAYGGRPTAEAVFVSLIIGFFGVSVATYGIEVVFNLLGKAGVGRRSDAALAARAEALVGTKTCCGDDCCKSN